MLHRIFSLFFIATMVFESTYTNAQQETGQPGNDGYTISSVLGVPTIPVVQIIPPCESETSNLNVGTELSYRLPRTDLNLILNPLPIELPPLDKRPRVDNTNCDLIFNSVSIP